jgi:phosphoenolpyruvate phosphomutase-like protein
MSEPTDLESRCDLLRSLRVPGTPLVLPNAWDVASARAVVAAGFPVVATMRAAWPPRLATRITSGRPVTRCSLPPRGLPQVSTSP